MKELEITNETPIAMLNVGQLKYILSLKEQPIIEKKDYVTDDNEYVFGIAGLAKLLNCSKPTAQILKSSGKISFKQTGRKIVFDKNQVLQEISFNKKTIK